MVKLVVGTALLGLLFGPAAVLLGLAATLNQSPEATCVTSLGGALPHSPAQLTCAGANKTLASFTIGTLNLLGAGHTDDRPGGGHTASSFPAWSQRLPRALRALQDRGTTIAGIQEVHRPQAHALATTYSDRWAIWPANGNSQNRVIWDRGAWRMTDARTVDIPYFNGHEVGMPLVQLTSLTTGQVVWVWSIHNPASTRGDARAHRIDALRRQLRTVDALRASGLPVFIVGDFNDGRDGENSAHCTLTPTLLNAFGEGRTAPCSAPRDDAPIDHIFGANIQFASATIDRSTQTRKISDHPLVVATTVGSTASCPPTDSPAEHGLTPDALLVLRSVNAQFGAHSYAGVAGRPNRSDHPSGHAVDVMIADWSTRRGIAEGNRIASWIQAHARELGVTYLIWRERIWNTGDHGWSPYTHPNGPTTDPNLRHLTHVHVSVAGTSATRTCTSADAGQVVYPVPANLASRDRDNWHDSGSRWGSWHTGTDFSVPCGTQVLAAHSGVVRIEDGPDWYGRWLVKVETGPTSLTTWYVHMQSLNVADGQTVAPGEQIGAVGAMGNASGCHLHFEVHLRNGSIYGTDNTNPTAWLAQLAG